MTGPEHYAAAESNLRIAVHMRDQGDVDAAAFAHAEAQIQATLALAAATVDGPAVMRPEDRDEWDRATGRLEVTS